MNLRCGLLLIACLLASCATRPVAPDGPLAFDAAVKHPTDDLVAQTQHMFTRGVVYDPTLDAGSGEQTGATIRLDAAVTERLTHQDRLEVLPFRSASLAKARYVLVSTLSRGRADENQPVRIDLALVDRESDIVVAQAHAFTRDEGLDHAPLPYYRDSPVLVMDEVVEGYIRTAATLPGQRGDRHYLERIAAAATLNEATQLYNQARYREALGEYRSALALGEGEQLRVLNGIYLATAKLGQEAEAEAAFARVVAMGIAYRRLSVKFLFAPGTTQFWSDPRINAPYPMWLRQIARETVVAGACMEVVGHTTRTGSRTANEALSLQRAAHVRRLLVAEAPELAARTKEIGMGFRENIIATGSDDAIDVLDRRVEFRIVTCGR